MFSKKRPYWLVIICLLSNLFVLNFADASGIPAPAINKVKSIVYGINDAYLLEGTSEANSEVLIYIDKTFVDFAEIVSEGNRVVFRYLIKKELTAGKHTVMAIGRDKTSLVLSVPGTEFEFDFQTLPIPPAPTILNLKDNAVISQTRPVIEGLTISGTFVHFHIDGKLSGQTKILDHKSGTASFSFQPISNLNAGMHTLSVTAQDKFGQKSTSSQIINFKIEKHLPAPTLIKTVLNKSKDVTKPYITGLSKNDLAVKVFINNQLDGEFKVNNHPSGTANFAYIPSKPLTKGKYSVYTTSIDTHGKESSRSNVLTYTVQMEPVNINIKPDTTPIAPDKEMPVNPPSDEIIEEIEPVNTPQETEADEEDSQATPEEKEEDSQATPEEKNEVEDLIKSSIGTTSVETGIIDETKTQQSKIKTNLIIFILFLLAVIGWIFWVNRELIKEKKAQTEKDEKDEKNKK